MRLAAVGEAEQRIAWLRLAAIPIIAVAESLPHPNPDRGSFLIAIALVSAYAVGVFAFVHLRPVTERFSLVATGADVAAITVLAVLSGGAFSEARLAYFLIPITVAFRFSPALTAVATGSSVVAYLAQAFAHPAAKLSHADRFIAVQAGYMLWLGIAAVLLSALLERRTRRIAELADARRRLIADSLTAEERERQGLAEGLHDHAIQNLLSVRHDLDEAGGRLSSPALARADTTLAETISALREAIFELHPYVLEQAGLEAALRALAQRASHRGGFHVHLELDHTRRHSLEGVLLATARELLANAVEHSGAANVAVRLHEVGGQLVLTVQDDGIGFDPKSLPERLAEGHIGLRSQRERIESVGGRLEIRSVSGGGTTVEVLVSL